MKAYPMASRREARQSAMTPQFLETMDEDAEYSDDDDPEATATERARAALQRRPQRDEDEEVNLESIYGDHRDGHSGTGRRR